MESRLAEVEAKASKAPSMRIPDEKEAEAEGRRLPKRVNGEAVREGLRKKYGNLDKI